MSAITIVHCYTHRQLCTPIVKAVSDEVIGAGEWRNTAHGCYVLMNPDAFYWHAIGGNHRLVLSRALFRYNVFQVIDLRHVMHMAHKDGIWDGTTAFRLTDTIMKKLLVPIQRLEAGTRGKTLADQYKLFESDMLRCFPSEEERTRVRGQTLKGRTTVLLHEFFAKVWNKTVGGTRWIEKVAREVGQNVPKDKKRITGTAVTSLAQSNMIQSESILAKCYNRNEIMHKVKDIYRGLVTLFDYKELHDSLHQFPFDPERTAVYLSGLGGSGQEFVDGFVKKVKRLTPQAKSESKIWEIVSQRRSQKPKDEEEEDGEGKTNSGKKNPRKNRKPKGSISSRQYDAILNFVPKSNRESANKAIIEAVEVAVAESLTASIKKSNRLQKQLDVLQTRVIRLKEKVENLEKELEKERAKNA